MKSSIVSPVTTITTMVDTMIIAPKLTKFFLIVSKQVISPTPAGINKKGRCSKSKLLVFSIILSFTMPVQSASKSKSIPITLLGTERLKRSLTNSPRMQKEKIIANSLKYFKCSPLSN